MKLNRELSQLAGWTIASDSYYKTRIYPLFLNLEETLRYT